ncbi:MAG: hypothetical protein AAF752_01505 [Bacteroidota bacterium]
MSSATWIGIVFGLLIAGANLLLSFLSHRKAHGLETGPFMRIVLGGMMMRMFGILLVVPLVLLFLPVEPVAFAFALVGGLIVGVVMEVVVLLRRRPAQDAAQP